MVFMESIAKLGDPMTELHITDLSEFTVRGRQLARNGAVIASFPTDIEELARLDERLFVVLHAPFDGDADFVGTNLWSLDLTGAVLWKAENLNTGYRKRAMQSLYRYASLAIFDEVSPKLHAFADEKWSPSLDPSTGKFLQVLPALDWSDYATAWPKFREAIDDIERKTFVRAQRFSPALAG